MKPRSPTASLVFAALLGAMTLAPIAAAFADTSPNTENNAMVTKDSTGNYDGFDRFRDASGRPLPGWEYLFYSPG
jgi:hypothetical protein